jgi:hypothetical protein
MTPTPNTDPTTVRVDLGARGAWEVALPGEGERLTCATLGEAQRIADVWALDHRPCDLVIRDAYHRVLRRELVTR